MPRKPRKTPHEIYQALEGLNFRQENGNMVPWNDPVWDLVVNNLNSSMCKDYLWLYLKENRNGVFNRLHNLSGTDVLKKKEKVVMFKDGNWSMSTPKCNFRPIKCLFYLTKKEWDSLGTHATKYNSRNYEVLEPGWSDKIYYKIWNRLELPYPFAFKSKINCGIGEVYLTIKGFCHECKTEIHLYSETPPTDDGINIIVSAWDTRDIIHKKKTVTRN
ncbi:unnamed protein product [Lasius platythorax]|uniref:Uncharacterized protein n=1 Tax=Lasius platythorax TaxID=488582 RepID=A0AAV2MWQ0_9HYME